jgi:hypothetical protein
MFLKDRGIKTDLFFGSVSIELPSERFEAVDDVKGFPLVGTLKSHMFPKMGEAFLFFVLISATHIQNKATMDQTGVCHFLVDDPNAVAELLNVVHEY